MPQDPLLTQLAERTRTFSAGTGVTLNKIAKLVGVEPGNFSAFMNGRIGLSAKSTIRLLQLLNLTKRQVQEKLTVKAVNIAHFQSEGKPMRLSDDGSGWVSKEGDSAADPNNQGGDVTNTWKANGAPSDDDLIDTLRTVDNYHKQAREAIAQWFANYRSAKPNKDGATEAPRRITDNDDSRRSGPRSALFP